MADYGSDSSDTDVGMQAGAGATGTLPVNTRRINTQTIKSIGYKTGSDKATQLISISKTSSATGVKTTDPKGVIIENTGTVPVVVACGYENYTSSTADSNVVYQHSLVPPGQSVRPLMRSIISTQGTNVDHTNASFGDQSLYNLIGTEQDFVAPNANLYVDTTLDSNDGTGGDITGSATETKVFIEQYTSATNCGANYFRVGDLIRITNEIMEVTAIGDKSDAANNYLTVKRGLYGSTAAGDHADDDAILLPFFNQYYDYDRVLSGSGSQLCQTDNQGRFKCSNFFGYGRSSSGTSGITPGSITFKFYESAYQEIAMGGTTSNIPINASTDSKLTANTAYTFSITIDDSSSTNVSFTVGSSTKFGGSAGVIAKMQAALDDLCLTTGNALYGTSATISIKNGMLCFTSDSHLFPHDGTNGSKIALAAGTGTDLLDGNRGIFPALAAVNAAVDPVLPDNTIYDPITYATSPNLRKFAYDDGNGNIRGMCIGKINYETGAIDLQQAPKNASFEVAFTHTGPFSGKIDSEESARANQLVDVYANVLNKYVNGAVRITTL